MSHSDQMQCEATFQAHADGVNVVASLPSSQGEGLVLTAGKDNLVKLWQTTPSARGTGGSWACRLLAQYAAHTDAVEGLAISPSGDRVASCGWDGALLLWRTGAEIIQATSEAAAGTAPATSSKKRKVGGSAGTAASSSSLAAVSESPTSRLEGHLHCVSSAAWPVEATIFSGGWDHSVSGKANVTIDSTAS